MGQNEFIEYRLIKRRLRGELTDEEEKVFSEWVSSDKRHKDYYARCEAEHNKEFEDELEFGNNDDIDVDAMISDFDFYVSKSKKRRLTLRRLRIAAVVMIPLVLAGMFSLLFNIDSTALDDDGILISDNNRAKLVLSDGRELLLNNKDDKDKVIDMGEVVISNCGSQISYLEQDTSKGSSKNTMIVPRGGEYVLVLSDGSKVWLNSQSRLTFPTKFDGKNRVVELEGEAYFQVTRNESQAFIVKAAGNAVKVYGTSFNVCAYRDDENMVTTLEEGSIGLFVDDKEYRLTPGKQAKVELSDKKVTLREVDAKSYCAWRNGLFFFEDENLETILDRLSKWYDVEFFYQNEAIKSLHFTGDLEKYEKFEDVLNLISLTTNVEFVVKNKCVSVKYK